MNMLGCPFELNCSDLRCGILLEFLLREDNADTTTLFWITMGAGIQQV